MPGKRYSAGAIFLQVVPVFANTQQAIEEHVKDIDRALGDRMEKAGEKAGDRAGKAMADKVNEHGKKAADDYAGHFETRVKGMVKSAERELSRLDLSTATEKMLKDLEKAKAELKALGSTDFNVDFDAKKVLAKVQTIKAAVEGLTAIDHELNIDANLRKVIKDAAKIEEIFDEATRDRTVEVKVDMDTKPVEREMSAFEKRLKVTAERAANHLSGSLGSEARRIREDFIALKALRIGVDVSAGRAKKELADLAADLKALDTDDVEVDVKLAILGALGELKAFDKELDRIDGRTVKVNAKVDNKTALQKLQALTAGGDNASNTFRSFNGILFAVTSLGPALIPILGSIAAGLLAIGPAAAVGATGLASVLIGFSGLGDAVTALSNRQSQAAKAAEQASDRTRSAYRGVRDARQALADAERTADRAAVDSARRVADARRQAAEQIKSALKQQRQAQEAYADSVKAVKDAERDLRDAREQAARDKQDLGFQIRENQLNLDQGLIDEFNAKVNLNAVNSDGSSTNLDKEQARIAYEQAKLRMEELRAEQKQLAEEKQKQDKGVSDSQKKVNDAQDKYTKALREQKDALNDVKEAERNVSKVRAEAARDIADALRDQRRSAEDNARAVARAQQGVNDALESQADALSNVSTQQEAVNEAMANLGPAGRHFARFLFGLQQKFQGFRNRIQEAMLPSIEEAISGFLGSKNGSAVGSLLVTMARSFGQFAKALSTSFQGPVWGEFFRTLAAVGPDISKAYGTAFIKFAEAMASMLTTAAPYALMFANGLAKMATSFADWAKSKEGREGVQRFMDWAVVNGPMVIDFLGHFVSFATKLASALAPWGDMVLKTLDGLVSILYNLDPQLLGGIALGFILIINASQSAYAVMQIILGATALFSSTVGIWVVAIVGIISALALLYRYNKGFRDFADKAWAGLSKVIDKAWKSSIKPALTGFWEAVKDLWQSVLAPFFKWAGPVFLWLAEKIIPLLGLSFKVNLAIITAGLRLLTGIIKVVAAVVGWLYSAIFHPIFSAIGAVVGFVFGLISGYWNNILWPVLSTIAKVVLSLYHAYFKVSFILIMALFKALGLAGKALWEHALKPVFKWIADGAKALWKFGIKPWFDPIANSFKVIWDGIKSVWNKHLKGFFADTVPHAVSGLAGAFETAIDGIKAAWDKLKDVVKAPIRFVIDKIINHGLIDGFNKIASWVGKKGFDYIEMPKSLQDSSQKHALGGVTRFATGGVLSGYTPGRDVHRFVSPTGGRLELSGGEAIMRPEFTAAVGKGFVDHFNYVARTGGVEGVRRAMGGQAFAKGGVFFPLPGGHYAPNYKNHDGVDINVGSGADDYGMLFYSATRGKVSYTGYGHGYGNAVFVSSPYGSLVYGHSIDGSIRVRPGQQVNPGTPLAQVGQTGNASAPHLHFGHPGGSYAWAKSLLAGAPVGKAGDSPADHPSIPAKILKFIKNPLAGVKSWITGAWDKAGELVSNPVFDVMKHTPLRMAKMVTDKAWSIIPGWAKTAAGWAGDAAHWAVGGVKNAADAVGDAVSGAGHAVADGASAVGDFLGFKDGGVLPYNGTMMYDNGGYLPPGLTSVVNLTGKPEPVFTADQFDGMGGSGSGGTIHYEPHFEGSDLTAEDVAGDMNFQFRRLRRIGKYEGVGS